MRKNKILKFLAIMMAIFMFVPLNTNASTPPIEYQVAFFDDANLMNDDEEQNIIQLAEQYKDELKMDIVFVTTTDTNGKPSMVYADDFYDGLEGGYEYYEDGILFLIDIYNGEVYISTAGRAINLMSDSEIEAALDEFFYARGDYDDYAAAMYAMAENALENMSYWDEKGADGTWYYIKPSRTQLWSGLILGGVLLIILYVKHNKANNTVSATQYINKEGYKLNNINTNFIKEYPIIHKNYYKPSSSSGSGGHSRGSSHRSSSGRSHGGGGRRL